MNESRTWAHWAWVVPILLVVAFLSIRQIDLYAHTLDEYFSLNNAGALAGPYSPVDIIASLRVHSSEHVPGYFLLLSAWGNLVGWDLAVTRLIAVFATLLSVAMMYRLVKDHVAQSFGLIGVIVLVSNTFANFYVTQTRMYPPLIFLGAVVVWLYLRLIDRQGRNRPFDYVVLFIASYALINTHALSVALFVTLGLYHLLFVAKNRTWWYISIAIGTAMILFAPYLTVIFGGFERSLSERIDLSIGFVRTIEVWLTLAFNSDMTLLGLTLIGVYFAYRQHQTKVKRYVLLVLLYLLVIGILAEVSSLVTENNLRYLLAGYAFSVPMIALGMRGLYQGSSWTILLVLFWVISGVLFLRQVDNWNQYIADRFIAFDATPYHIVSREARREPIKPYVLGYQNIGDSFFRGGRFETPQVDYFFRQYDIDIDRFNGLDDALTQIEQESVALPSVWLVYRQREDVLEDIADIQIALGENYTRCEVQYIGVESVIEKYVWDFLDCALPTSILADSTGDIDYTFYTTAVNPDESRLWFVDQWESVGDNTELSMSYQLLTPDWDNVAQIDLPLVHEGALRRFALDIETVEAGTYRLVAVLYDPNTGMRQDWTNGSDILTLSEVVIP